MEKEHLSEENDAQKRDKEKIAKLEKSLKNADIYMLKETYAMLKKKVNFFETEEGKAYIDKLKAQIEKIDRVDSYNKSVEKKFIILMIAVTSVCVVAAVTYGYKYFRQEYIYKESQEEIEELKSLIENPVDADTKDSHSLLIDEGSIDNSPQSVPGSSLVIGSQKPILKKFKTIFNKNTDFIGWLEIKGTSLSCPVVQTRDNDYYLSHDFAGNASEIGLPFLDYRNNWVKQDDNLIIYGHNLKNDNMFGSLRYYLDKEYYKKHRYIEFDTLYEKGRYEIACVCLTKVAYSNEDVFRYYDFLMVDTEEEYNAAAEAMKKEACYDTGVKIRCGDKLLTLSTCSKHVDNGRLYIVARKVKE